MANIFKAVTPASRSGSGTRSRTSSPSASGNSLNSGNSGPTTNSD